MCCYLCLPAAHCLYRVFLVSFSTTWNSIVFPVPLCSSLCLHAFPCFCAVHSLYRVSLISLCSFLSVHICHCVSVLCYLSFCAGNFIYRMSNLFFYGHALYFNGVSECNSLSFMVVIVFLCFSLCINSVLCLSVTHGVCCMFVLFLSLNGVLGLSVLYLLLLSCSSSCFCDVFSFIYMITSPFNIFLFTTVSSRCHCLPLFDKS